MIGRPLRTLVLMALPFFMAGSGFADDVYLTNGKVYEDVIAKRTAEGVRIELAFGQMLLSNELVERIETAVAPLEEYRRIEQSLESSKAPAEDWLDLARWAQSNDLSHGARLSSLRAALLDPALPGLEPFMSEQSRVLDPDSNRWIPEAQFLRSRGFVEVDGRWLSSEEAELHAAAVRQREAEERELRVAQSMEAAAERLERAERHAAQRREEQLLVEALRLSRPVVIVQSGVVVRSPAVRSPSRGVREARRETPSTTYRRLANRQPGSFIPVSQYSPTTPYRAPSFDDHPSLRTSRSAKGAATAGATSGKPAQRTTARGSSQGSRRETSPH